MTYRAAAEVAAAVLLAAQLVQLAVQKCAASLYVDRIGCVSEQVFTSAALALPASSFAPGSDPSSCHSQSTACRTQRANGQGSVRCGVCQLSLRVLRWHTVVGILTHLLLADSGLVLATGIRC